DSVESYEQDLRESDGVEVVIAYTSKHLNDREAKWSATEKEAYAIIHTIDVFRTYLYGRKFTVFTDHRPLEWDTEKWIELQQKDEYCRAILQEMAKASPSKDVKINLKRKKKGLLADVRGQTVTPVRLLPQILKENHDHILAGHLGVGKMLARLQRQYTWPCMHANRVRPTGLLFTATPTGESKWYAIKEYQTLNCIAEEITLRQEIPDHPIESRFGPLNTTQQEGQFIQN
ncbi:Uncharacterized protein APZ42_029739, partial [Daphnia magna]